MITEWAIPESVRKYLAAAICAKCKKNMGNTDTMPCPYCHNQSHLKRKIKLEPIEPPKPIKYVNPKYKVLIYSSSSRPDIKHKVQCTQKGVFVSCSCEGFYYRRGCWHRDDVLFNKGKKGEAQK